MRLVDTHCHLMDRRFDEDREEVIARALDVLEWIVVIGENPGDAPRVVALARSRVYAAVGYHPYHAGDLDDAAAADLAGLLRQPHVVALGEIGLDYYNEFTPRAVQAPAFERQLALAAELGLPVVVHNRQADEDSHALLAQYVPRLPGCVLHCYGSDAAFARRCVDLGCYISFAGNVVFPKAQPLRDAAAAVPLDRLLIETDAPYLAPPPMRGKRCEPAFVVHTARLLAEVKGVALEALGEQTTANAKRFFQRIGSGSAE